MSHRLWHRVSPDAATTAVGVEGDDKALQPRGGIGVYSPCSLLARARHQLNLQACQACSLTFCMLNPQAF